MLVATLLKKALQYIHANPLNNGALIIKIEASNAELSVDDFIHQLDVRHIGTLRALVPEAFPKKLRTGRIEITMNIHGAWRVDPEFKFEMPASWGPARRQDSGGFYG